MRETCVYCGNDILRRSKEHIIQNALGGLYESDNICCGDCNNILSKKIDAPFTKTFNPIISQIKNLVKTNKSSPPICSGKAIHNNDIYDVLIKDGKVVGCPELCKKLKCDVSKLDFKIIGYDFLIENSSFKKGISKIAFNYALEKGIDFKVLRKGITVIKEKDDKVSDILFDFPIIPFVSLNPIDEYIELKADMELYHNLILFSQSNQLWCYVDLFNTFQYYVLLSDEWNAKKTIFENDLQFLQKPDRTIPDLYIRKPKHILNYAMWFDVEPCIDVKEFRKRVETSVKKESVKKNMSDVIYAKLDKDYFNSDKLKTIKNEDTDLCLTYEMTFYLKSLWLYFDENDKLRESTFRQVTYMMEGDYSVSYPMLINSLMQDGLIDIRSYTTKKFERLNTFLLNE